MTERKSRCSLDNLLSALSPYGVTNEALDKVSDYYRYQPGSRKLWRTRPAVAYVTLSGDTVKSVTIVDGGSGYSSVPVTTVKGHPAIKLDAKLAYGRDLTVNGSIEAISGSGEGNR